jgi:hypothetical protein
VRCPVTGLANLSYHEWLVRLPVKLYVWGQRSLKDTCGPAYMGAMETAIPSMAARSKICPQLSQVWGWEECWGEGAYSQTRWHVLLGSGCREGQELRQVWDRLTGEAEEASHWLLTDVKEVFVTAIEGAGAGSVSAETSRRIVEAREISPPHQITGATQAQERQACHGLEAEGQGLFLLDPGWPWC